MQKPLYIERTSTDLREKIENKKYVSKLANAAWWTGKGNSNLTALPILIAPRSANADACMRQKVRLALEHVHANNGSECYAQKKGLAPLVRLCMKAITQGWNKENPGWWIGEIKPFTKADSRVKIQSEQCRKTSLGPVFPFAYCEIRTKRKMKQFVSSSNRNVLDTQPRKHGKLVLMQQ